jgi:RecG-like helicase
MRENICQLFIKGIKSRKYKKLQKLKTWSMDQVEECLPSKYKDLRSNRSITKKKKSAIDIWARHGCIHPRYLISRQRSRGLGFKASPGKS